MLYARIVIVCLLIKIEWASKLSIFCRYSLVDFGLAQRFDDVEQKPSVMSNSATAVSSERKTQSPDVALPSRDDAMLTRDVTTPAASDDEEISFKAATQSHKVSVE